MGAIINSTETSILVVDDDLHLLELLVETLESFDYQVTAAHSGPEALEKLAGRSYDLVITDIRMPGMDGIELLNEVRKRYSGLPVLLISGFSGSEAVGATSADGFVPKPFRFANMEQLIENALESQSGKQRSEIRRVLIVDRDQSFRKVLSDALEQYGFAAFTVGSAAEALAEMEHGRFDILITELNAGDTPASVLLKEVQLMRPETVAIVTGEDLPPGGPVPEFDTDSFVGFLGKPFRIEDLLRLLSGEAEAVV